MFTQEYILYGLGILTVLVGLFVVMSKPIFAYILAQKLKDFFPDKEKIKGLDVEPQVSSDKTVIIYDVVAHYKGGLKIRKSIYHKVETGEMQEYKGPTIS